MVIYTDSTAFCIRWMVRTNQSVPRNFYLSSSEGVVESRYVSAKQKLSDL